MRIALFSDIHANLPALEACLKSIEEQQVDALYCLGDLVGYNIWPNEVVNEIRKRGIPTIAGNYDQGIGLMIDECGCAYKTDPEKDMGKVSISYTNHLVKPEERKYLRTLPSHIGLSFS
jgi:predicted phosphodiesterase